MDFMEKTRNGLCFQGTQWTEMQNLMRRFIGLLRNWRRVYKIGVARGTRRSLKPPCLIWEANQQQDFTSDVFGDPYTTIKEHNSNERVDHCSHEHILARHYSDNSHGCR
jgi:hypothetical protein